METIRNYLMTMFASLPNTPQVRRAMDELWQMMEDKYTELIEEGRTENEAIGTVIAEFGNLDELAEPLGIRDYMPPAVRETPTAEGADSGETAGWAESSRMEREEYTGSAEYRGNGAHAEESGKDLFRGFRDRLRNRDRREQREQKEQREWSGRRNRSEDRVNQRASRRESRRASRRAGEQASGLYTVSADEAQEFLNAAWLAAYLRGLGVFFFIVSVAPVSLFDDASGVLELTGMVMFFLCIAAGIALMLISSGLLKPFKHLKRRKSCLDYAAARHVENMMESIRSSTMAQRTVGIILCVLSVVPVIGVDILSIGSRFLNALGMAFFLLMVGIGVMLIMLSAGRNGACKRLLRLGDPSTIGGSSTKAQRETGYIDPRVEDGMSVYWQTVTAIYLCWSFLTFQWGISWLIWPVAGVLKAWIDRRYGRRDDRPDGRRDGRLDGEEDYEQE